jgi:hypothetical protein
MAKTKKLKDWEKDKLREQTLFYNPSIHDACRISSQVEASFTDILTSLCNGDRSEERFITRVNALSSALLTTPLFIDQEEANEAANTVYNTMRQDLRIL